MTTATPTFGNRRQHPAPAARASTRSVLIGCAIVGALVGAVTWGACQPQAPIPVQVEASAMVAPVTEAAPVEHSPPLVDMERIQAEAADLPENRPWHP